MATKANRAGTTSSREAAINAQTAASQPRVYDREPAARPADVPWGQTLPNGNYSPIYYDSVSRGYGFWDAAGHWVLWNAMLNSGPRYYGAPYGSGYASAGGYASANAGGSFFPMLLGLLFVGGIVVAAVYLYRQQSNEVSSILDRRRAPLSSFDSVGLGAVQPTARTPRARRSAALAPWLDFPAGSFVTLSDSQSLEDSQKRGEGFKGIRFAVESTIIADDMEGFGTWVMLRLNDNHQQLLLLIKSVDNAMDFRLYYANEEFHPARREEVVRRGDTWLFEAPEDENNFDAADLRYTAELIQSTGDHELAYVRKEQGERHATVTETPNPLGFTQQVATIVEYATADETENPELMILEIGTASRRTGEVALYLGCPIRESEIDVLKAASAV